MTAMFGRLFTTFSKVYTGKPVPEGMKAINLLRGWPSTSLFPKQELVKATEDMLSDKPDVSDESLIYGPDPGSEIVRERVGNWLAKYYKPAAGDILAERIFIGNGASATLSIILEKFTDPIYTRRIWMIEPTYFMACPIFEDNGFKGRLRGVPEDDEGVDIEFLRNQLTETDREVKASPVSSPDRLKDGTRYPKLYRHIIYVVPTFSNPGGKVMSVARRMELVRLARKHDALVITDDVYDMLRWPTDPKRRLDDLAPSPPRLVDIDRSLGCADKYGNACSNGSFSKIVAPGVRCSWVEGTEDFIGTLSTHGATQSGGCPSQMMSLVIYKMLESGSLNDHLMNQVLPTYRKRYYVMMDSIKQHLEPLGVRVTGGLPVTLDSGKAAASQEKVQEQVAQAGGFFCYIMFPDDLPTADEVARRSLKSYALRIAPGQLMIVAGDDESNRRCGETFGHGARLSWSWCTEDEIREGIERLAIVIKDIRKTR